MLALQSKLRKSVKAKPRADAPATTPRLAVPAESPEPLSQSPVPHLLVSNDAPSEEETSLIHHAILRAETELAELARSPTTPKGTPQHLWEHGIEKHPTYVRVLGYIQQHTALLSAVRRVPPEILEEIIMWTAVGRPLHEVRARRWELAQVSQEWRDAALGLSALWADLPPVTLPAPDFKRAQQQVACLSEVLRRSGDAPLTVTINTDDSKTRESAHWHPALDVLARHAERWSTVSICIPHASIVRLRGVRGRLPLLKMLSLQIRIGYCPVPEPLDMFEHAPLLRRVHVSGAVPSALKLPFEQLQHYKHLCITERTMSQMANYTSLETLMISQQTYGIVFPPMTLPALKKLEVVANLPAQDATMHCFDALKVPALEELTVAFPFTSPSIIPSLMAMLKHSGRPCLKTLNIRPGTLEPLQLTALLKLVPDLINLDASCPPHFDILKLANTAHGECLVPLLRSCKFVFDFVIERFTNAQTRVALNRLATARCETAPRDARMTLCIYSVFNQVDDMPWSHFKQRQLEEWAPTPTAKTLEKYAAHLAALLRVTAHPKPERVLSLGKDQSTEKIRQVLSDLGNISVKNAKDVYVRISCRISLGEIHTYLCDACRYLVPIWRLRF